MTRKLSLLLSIVAAAGLALAFAAPERTSAAEPPRAILPPPGPPPPPPFVGAWGDYVSGLRVRLQVDTMGIARTGILNTEVQFEYNPKKGLKDLTTLLHHPAAGVATLTFKDRKSGRVYDRVRTSPGFTETPGPPDYYDLKGILIPQEIEIRLLSPTGEMITPGDYDVTVTYVNEKAMELTAHSKNYEGRLWSGTARSKPLRLKVPEVGVRKISFVAWDSLEAFHDLPVVSWRWNMNARQRPVLDLRPGYISGHRERAVLLFPSSERDVRLDVSASLDISPGGAANVTQDPHVPRSNLPGPEPPIPFSPDSLLGIRLEEIVFETSMPTTHNWSPEAGDYRVLWQHTVTAKLQPKAPVKPAN